MNDYKKIIHNGHEAIRVLKDGGALLLKDDLGNRDEYYFKKNTIVWYNRVGKGWLIEYEPKDGFIKNIKTSKD